MSESPNSQGPAPDGILSESILALQSEDDAQGPLPDVHQRVLAALRQPAPKPRATFNFIQRTIHMARVHKTAAAFIVSTGGLLAWMTVTLLSPLSSISYGDVAEQIKEAKTIQFQILADINGTAAPVSASKVLMKEPGFSRVEMAGTVVIIDGQSGKVLSLSTATKTAQVVAFTPKFGLQGSFDTIASFKKLADAVGTPIEDREIGGIKARGFESKIGAQTIRVWANPKTRLPLLIESSSSGDGQAVKLTMSDFVFDQPLDDGLFSLTPPAGYTLSAEYRIPTADEMPQTVASILKVYAERANGQFPKSLDDFGAYATVMANRSTDGKIDPEGEKVMTDVGALSVHLTNLEKGTDYNYTPDGARLGDANKIVFWVRSKQTGTYRAVFGDLKIREVSEEQVFKK